VLFSDGSMTLTGYVVGSSPNNHQRDLALQEDRIYILGWWRPSALRD
jgi:hypothetical protein